MYIHIFIYQYINHILNFRWNPFARKSQGILGVIKAQTKKNIVVSKHGRINVYRKTEDSENKYRYEIKKISKLFK